jgi:hypothetical protein
VPFSGSVDAYVARGRRLGVLDALRRVVVFVLRCEPLMARTMDLKVMWAESGVEVEGRNVIHFDRR